MTRGDIHRITLPAGRGHEQRGPRYAVILQADALLGLSTAIVAPTSTSALPATFRPTVAIADTPTRLLVEQLRTIDLRRLGDRVGTLSADEQRSVDQALEIVLDL
ncbi:MAG: putative prevent-host-death protein putative antitoxin of system, putative pemK domain [Conexibacter sp.]|nr:putative prevent-host-death protein putative antitoxin of system, putative pemK domain [Conexibacter sp.]